MKRAISTITGLLLLAGLIILSVYLFQAVGSQPASAIVEATQAPNYPPPYDGPPATGYPPPPLIPTISETELAELSATNLAEVTAIVAKTLTAQPTVEEMPIEGDKVIYDPTGQMKLNLRKGWRAYISTNITITNYDAEKISHADSLDQVKIKLGIGELPNGQTYSEWQADWILAETSPSDDFSGQTATVPIPINLGSNEGYTYFLSDGRGSQEIHLIIDTRRIVIIQITPSNSGFVNEVLEMLSTITIIPTQEP